MDEMLAKLLKIEKRIARLETLESGSGITYAEGSWTPAWAGTGTAGTFTYAANGQVGRYTRIGNRIFISGYLEITATTVAPTGNIVVTGLPLTSANVANLRGGIVIVTFDNVNFPGGAFEFTGRILPNTTQIELGYTRGGTTWANYPAASFTNNIESMSFVGQYQI